ncbi:hypothetical protein ACIBL3_46630 [Kribbella sp. NPDC050124]|uniref:hypothetical protein n=1 Tax=Kribbella sp. NPDC050124 TaxID=3364114 RepID=UPI0037A58C69
MYRFAIGLTVALTLGAAAVPAAALASQRPHESPDVTEYVGRWNYDLPDRDDGINVAELKCLAAEPDCPSPFPFQAPGSTVQLPQIGDIVFWPGAEGTVIGRTNVGCTWRFAVHERSLELADGPQYCFNQVIGSGYTLTRWSIAVTGPQERETIAGVSHHPARDYQFVLADGRRTKVDDSKRTDTTRLFTGDWEYDPPNPDANINIGIYRNTGSGGAPTARPQTGRLTVTSASAHTVAVRTPDGCRWDFAVRGNTAALHPAGQTCQLPDATVAISFWTIASDGKHQASVIRGSIQEDGQTSTYALTGGALTEIPPRSSDADRPTRTAR